MKMSRPLSAAACLVAFVAVVAVVVMTPVGASAQAGPSAQAPAGRDGRPAREGLTPMEVVAMLDAYAIVQAQEALALTDDQYPQFVTRLKRLQEVRRGNQRERGRLLQDLRRLVGPGPRNAAPQPPDEAGVREKLKALRDLDDRTHAELQKAYASLDEVLDVRQQGRFRTFEEMLERRKLDLLVRARERAARGARDPGSR
jgi:hypothetical protein